MIVRDWSPAYYSLPPEMSLLFAFPPHENHCAHFLLISSLPSNSNC